MDTLSHSSGETYTPEVMTLRGEDISISPNDLVPMGFQHDGGIPNYVRDKIQEFWMENAPGRSWNNGLIKIDRAAWNPPASIFAMYNFTGHDEAWVWDAVNGRPIAKAARWSKEKWIDEVIQVLRNTAVSAVLMSWTELDQVDMPQAYIKRYYYGSHSNTPSWDAATFRFKMIRTFPFGKGADYDYADIEKVRKSFFDTCRTISHSFYDPIIPFVQMLKKFAAFGISFNHSKKQYVIKVNQTPNNLSWVGKYAAPPSPRDDPTSMLPENMNRRIAYTTLQNEYFGYNEEQNLEYKTLIEHFFVEDVVARMVTLFNAANVDIAGIWDEGTLTALFSDRINALHNIDNVIDSPIPCHVDNAEGKEIANYALSIPEKIRVMGEDYYPRARLKELYKKAISAASHSLWVSELARRESKAHTPEYVLTPEEQADADDPTKNPFLVYDSKRSVDSMVFTDATKNRITAYNTGRDISYGTVADVRATEDAYKRGAELFRYGEPHSIQDMRNLGVPDEGSVFMKFLPLAILAVVGTAIYTQG